MARGSGADDPIGQITSDRLPHYEPYGCHHSQGVDATLRIVDPEETGAEHCQHDNPTIGQELIANWLADRFSIDQRALLRTGWNPLV